MHQKTGAEGLPSQLLLVLAYTPLKIYSPWGVSEHLHVLNATFQNKWPSEAPKYFNKQGMKSVPRKPLWLNNSSFFEISTANCSRITQPRALCSHWTFTQDAKQRTRLQDPLWNVYLQQDFFWKMQYCLPSQVPRLFKIARESRIFCSVKGRTLISSGI